MSPDSFPEIAAALRAWYLEHQRDLPWRKTGNPYHIWLSEIMLQQTRVEAVKPYFERFVNELPDIRSLAGCRLDRLLKLWEGLGYYSRARNLQKAAGILMRDYDGMLPADYDKLLKLPGIGPYTAGAVASIAFRIPVPAVDGNVIRVVTRITADASDIRDPKLSRKIREKLLSVIPHDEPGIFNQALMELGAMICIPNGKPACAVCPVKELCLSEKQNLTDRIPFKSPAPRRAVQEKTILVLKDGKNTLLHKREDKGLLAGLYELPSLPGFMDIREILAYLEGELQLFVLKAVPLPDAVHVFTHLEWRMKGYLILAEDLQRLNGRDGYIVIEPERTEKEYPVPAAFRAYAEALKIRVGITD